MTMVGILVPMSQPVFPEYLGKYLLYYLILALFSSSSIVLTRRFSPMPSVRL